jgi:hypothetical protein
MFLVDTAQQNGKYPLSNCTRNGDIKGCLICLTPGLFIVSTVSIQLQLLQPQKGRFGVTFVTFAQTERANSGILKVRKAALRGLTHTGSRPSGGTKEIDFSTFRAVIHVAEMARGAHHGGMTWRFNRGSSILAALLLVGALAVVTFAMQALSGPQNPQSQAAQSASVWDTAPHGTAANITVTSPAVTSAPAPSLSNKAPATCPDAIQAAINAHSATDPSVTSTDTGKSGILDACHGAISNNGQPGKVASDYTCYGRSGTALIANGMVTIVTSADKSVKPDGTCKIQVCNGSMQSCGPAQAYSNGLYFSNATGMLDGTSAPAPANFVTTPGVPGYSGSTAAPAASGYTVDANGTLQISTAFAPSVEPTTAVDGWTTSYGVNPATWDSATALPYAPTNPVTSAGLDCPSGNCTGTNLQPTQDLTPGATPGQLTPAQVQAYCADNQSDPACANVSLKSPPQQQCPSGQTGVFPNCKAAAPWTGPGAQTPGPQTPTPAPTNNNNGLSGLMNAIMGGLAKALASPTAATGAACATDPTTYAQQQQQYNTALQQYNTQLQQYQYQQQISSLTGQVAPIPPVAPAPCTQTSSSNTCPAAPAQPACPAGTAPQPTTSQSSTGYSCTSGWQCVPVPVPTAQISCQPQVADVGMSIAISYSCGGATGSTGQGFDSQNQTSGSTTTVITTPPAGATAANYGINCTNGTAAGQAQCSVQIDSPSIVLLANPKTVNPGSASTIGWITTSMKSCVVSSPEDAAFTAANASNTSVNGMASTSLLTTPEHIVLDCVTLGGGTREATTTVNIVGQPDISTQNTTTSTVTVQSSADGGSVARGDTVNVSWSAANPPAGAQVALWLYDVRLGQLTALIQIGLDASSTYAWQLPGASDACDATSNVVCGTDLVPGRQYAIEAALYTPTSDPTNPTYLDYNFTPANFTISS